MNYIEARIAKLKEMHAEVLMGHITKLFKSCEVENISDNTIDELFDWIDDLFWAGKFQIVDDALKTIDATKCGPTSIIAILSICRPAHSQLSFYDEFYKKAHDHLSSRPDWDSGWLRGLER